MHSPPCGRQPRMSLAVASRGSKSIRLCLARRGSLETSPQLRGPSYNWRASHARKRRKFRRLAMSVRALLHDDCKWLHPMRIRPSKALRCRSDGVNDAEGTRQWRDGEDRDEHTGVSAFGGGRTMISQGSQLSEARRAIQLRRPNLG
ncbi:hypothetical protein L1887_43975 [Cichorium endivia]|nr:hypothetical protein L1887_43975 [Cichorium endivia]